MEPPGRAPVRLDLGRSLGETLVPARFRDAHELGLRDYLRTGLGPILQRRLRFNALRRDGTELLVEMMINVVAAGGARVFYGTLRDLSAEEAERLESQRALAASSRQFETLLSNSGLVFYDWDYGSGEVSYVGDLARFLGVRSGESPPSVQHWLDHIHPEDLPSRQEGSFDGIWPIEADSTQILQVLINLGLNARDAMPEGGTFGMEARNLVVDAAVATKLGVKADRYVCLSVRDTGCGIAPEIQGKIFDPFFTTKEVGKGTGLGLAMVYGIMRSHGGAVTVDSEPGKGAEFRLYLPAAAEVELPSSVPGEVSPSSAYGERLRGKTILVVDDEPLLRNLALEILEPLGAKLYFAEDGIAALEVFRAHEREIDIVLLDVGMPRMDGIAAYKRLRRINPQVKVVLATGYTESVEIRSLLKGENVLFVEKPFTVQTLTDKLEG